MKKYSSIDYEEFKRTIEKNFKFMKFKNLEITGFKSFSEKTTILIEKGLTSVSPNGCGKSNIVEALRWCMGKIHQKV